MVPLNLMFTSGLLVPLISLEVQIWCLIRKHVSFHLVAVILATDWPVSLLIPLQMFATASLSSSDRVLGSLSICTLFRVVTALVLKPNPWTYHKRKLSRVSLSLAMCRVLEVVLAKKAQYYMAVTGLISLINCQMQR
jgi:hypothetical protein